LKQFNPILGAEIISKSLIGVALKNAKYKGDIVFFLRLMAGKPFYAECLFVLLLLKNNSLSYPIL